MIKKTLRKANPKNMLNNTLAYTTRTHIKGLIGGLLWNQHQLKRNILWPDDTNKFKKKRVYSSEQRERGKYNNVIDRLKLSKETKQDTNNFGEII